MRFTGGRTKLPAQLEGVQLKLERAEAHLEELRAVAARVTAGYSAAVALERTDEGDRVTCRLRGAPRLPRYFTTLVGDCLHNMRSALDHLAWRLVLRDGGEPDRGRTQFPIWLTPPADDEPGPTVVGGVSADTRLLLGEVQPYRWRDDDLDPARMPLAVLHHLNNVDKHRGLLVGVTVMHQASWSSEPEQSVNFELSRRQRALVDGDEVGWFLVDPPGSPVHDLSLDFQVRLQDEPEAGMYAFFDLVEWALAGPLHYIANGVLRRFVPLFE